MSEGARNMDESDQQGGDRITADDELDEISESLSVRDQSALYFSYPFAFDRAQFGLLAASIAGSDADSEAVKEEAASIWELQNVAAVKGYLLPHLSRQFNNASPVSADGSNTAVDGRDEAAPPGVFLWRLSQDAWVALCNGAPFRPDSDIGIDGGKPTWTLQMPGKGRRRIAITISDVRLALFGTGAGSLTLIVKPHTSSLRDWLDCNYYLAKRRGATLRLLTDHETELARIDIDDLFSVLLSSRQQLSTSDSDPDVPWWSEVFVPQQTFPFPTLFIAEDQSEEELGSITTRIRYGFRAGQRIEPAQWQLSDDAGEIFHYSKRSVFVFSIDAAGFVAAGAPEAEFWTRTLPDHLRDTYLLALIIVLAQRTTLVKISKAVAENWDVGTSPQEHRYVFRTILSDLLEFTARLQFTQIFQTEHYHACYLRYRKAFRLDDLYQEVQDEVAQMSGILDHESERRRNDLTLLQTSLLGALLAVFSVRGALNITLTLPPVLNWAAIASTVAVLLSLPLLIMHQEDGYGRIDRVVAALCGATLCWLGLAVILWNIPLHSSTAWSALVLVPGAVIGLLLAQILDRNGERQFRTRLRIR